MASPDKQVYEQKTGGGKQQWEERRPALRAQTDSSSSPG